jgi:hypothetical protein
VPAGAATAELILIFGTATTAMGAEPSLWCRRSHGPFEYRQHDKTGRVDGRSDVRTPHPPRPERLAHRARRRDHRAHPPHQEERFIITVGEAHFTSTA